MKTRRLDWELKCAYRKLFILNGIVPNRFVDVDCLNSRRCCLVNIMYSFDVRWFSNTVSGVNVTWRRLRARCDSELLNSSYVDVEGFVLSVVSESSYLTHRCLIISSWQSTRHMSNKRCQSSKWGRARYFRSRSTRTPLTKLVRFSNW